MSKEERAILRGALAYIATLPVEDTRSSSALVRSFQLIAARALRQASEAQL